MGFIINPYRFAAGGGYVIPAYDHRWKHDWDATDEAGTRNGAATNLSRPTPAGASQQVWEYYSGSTISYIDIGSQTTASSFYISVRVKLDADTGGQQWIMSQESGTLSSQSCFYLRRLNTTPTTWCFDFGGRCGTTHYYVYNVANVHNLSDVTSNWAHVVAYHDVASSQLWVYYSNSSGSVNTTPWTVSTNGSSFSNNTSNIRIGQRAGSTSSGSYVDGRVALVHYDNIVPSTSDVTNLFDEGMDVLWL